MQVDSLLDELPGKPRQLVPSGFIDYIKEIRKRTNIGEKRYRLDYVDFENDV